MKGRRIYIVGQFGEAYTNWCEGQIVKRMEEANLVLFTGGEDVSPDLYGKKKHPTTGNNPIRDAREVAEFKLALSRHLPMLGICRGSQFLCVMAGGILVQHQQHPFMHLVTTSDGRVIQVTSTHHQRQYIARMNGDAQLLAWAEHVSPYSFGESDQDRMDEDREAEIVYYPKIRALAIQSHPEIVFQHKPEQMQEWERQYIAYCRELLNMYLR